MIPDLKVRLQESLGARYSIKRQVGEGPYGIVYLATDRHQRSVAIKMVRAALMGALGVERVLRELEITARLNHPNILPVLDSGRFEETLYYVMPFLESESLRQRLDRTGFLPPAETLRISQDIANAVAYAHEHHVLHQDINPWHVFLEPDRAIVKDFWIARAFAKAEREVFGNLTTTDRHMVRLQSPQQARGLPVDERTDVFYLAALIYEMLGGAPKEPLKGDAPAKWGPILARGVADKRADRPAGPLELVGELAKAFGPDSRMLMSAPRAKRAMGLFSWLFERWGSWKMEPESLAADPDPFGRMKDSLKYRYAIGRRIGIGGMAVVFLADDLRYSGRKVALKILKTELAHGVGSERFLQEIMIMAQLTHPLILPLLDSGDVSGHPFYAMPYVDGESLRDRLTRTGKPPLKEAIAIAQDIGTALDYAHRQKVIHRDIKPDNVLLYESRALVSDFGISLALNQARRITEKGFMVGTPNYMSPEQFWDTENIDHRTDLYSLGCLLYELLSGTPPYEGDHTSLPTKHLTAPIPSIRDQRPDVPEQLDSVLKKALAKRPVHRFDTAGAFVTALSLA